MDRKKTQGVQNVNDVFNILQNPRNRKERRAAEKALSKAEWLERKRYEEQTRASRL